MASPTLEWFALEVDTYAKELSLDARLIAAICDVESEGITSAYRFEPLFWGRYLIHKPEWADQNPRRVSASYGLMQIMYPVAVERGLRGAPEQLFLPDVGLRYGCLHLRHLLDWAAGFPTSDENRLRAALAAYNGGKGGNNPLADGLRNATYARKVLSMLNRST